MEAYIMRGIPGSGKSTWVGNIVRFYEDRHKSVLVCSADHYHIVNGEYRFDPKNVTKAHNSCLKTFLYEGRLKDVVIVDNTNISAWEISPYYRLAEMFEYKVTIVQVVCPFEVAIKRQTHRVPDEKIFAMYTRMMSEILPSHWKIHLVDGTEPLTFTDIAQLQ